MKLDYRTEKDKIEEFFKNLSQEDFEESLKKAGLDHYKTVRQVVFSGEDKMTPWEKLKQWAKQEKVYHNDSHKVEDVLTMMERFEREEGKPPYIDPLEIVTYPRVINGSLAWAITSLMDGKIDRVSHPTARENVHLFIEGDHLVGIDHDGDTWAIIHLEGWSIKNNSEGFGLDPL